MDATDLHALHSDPVVHRYWDAPPWSDPARAERFLAAATAMVGEETGVRLAVVRQIDDQFLGWCGLSRLDSTHRSATLTCCLKVEAWGRGIATEAVGALLSWGFSHLDLHRVQAETDAENAAQVECCPSSASSSRAGFEKTASSMVCSPTPQCSASWKESGTPWRTSWGCNHRSAKPEWCGGPVTGGSRKVQSRSRIDAVGFTCPSYREHMLRFLHQFVTPRAARRDAVVVDDGTRRLEIRRVAERQQVGVRPR